MDMQTHIPEGRETIDVTLRTVTIGVSPPLKGTEAAKNGLQRVKYSHDALIDHIIANPRVKRKELAELVGFSEHSLSRIMNSDAFLARLAERKAALVDPTLVMTVDEKLRAIASKSADIVLEKLETTANVDLALRTLETSTKAMGYGARAPQAPAVTNNFVVALPTKSESEKSWAEAHAPYGPKPIDNGQVTDV